MTVCVFVGPTLSPAEAAAGGAVVLPPVAQGDVVAAVRRHAPHAIGIIDGLFGGAPAVWHKEILWALGQGVAVFGSASMGALRAAELHPFGMQGAGRIFEGYRDGTVEDDDEVALVHGPAELGYPTLSEPMANVRATLAHAEAEGVIDPTGRDTLEALAKAQHFADRTWPGLLAEAGPALGASMCDRLAAWLETGRVDQKRLDALAMLAAMHDASRGAAPPLPFHFAATHHWQALLARTAARPGQTADVDDLVVDELRLGPEPLYRAVAARALLHRAVLDGPTEPTPDAPDDAVASLRRRLGLFTTAALEAWLAANDTTAEAFRRLAERALQVDRFEHGPAGRSATDLLDALRLGGDYPRLAARARAKAAALSRGGHSLIGVMPPGERVALRHAFAARRTGGAEGADLGPLLDGTGFADAEALDQALRREHLYLTLGGPAPEH